MLKKHKKELWIELIYAGVLLAFTVYLLLDTFVLTKKIIVVDNAQT